MLPFHTRGRVPSSIEISSADFEPVELPQVRPPSVRPPSVRPPSVRPPISFSNYGDDEMTVVRPDKRPSSVPPPRSAYANLAPRSPPVLSMSTSSRLRYSREELPPPPPSWAPPPPPSSVQVQEPPPSVAAVDANASAGRQVDLSMTSSVSGMTDIRRLRRPTLAWGAGLVAVGVVAGLVAAFVAPASLAEPTASRASADVAKIAAPQPYFERPSSATPAQPAPLPPAPVPVAPAPAAQPPSCAVETGTEAHAEVAPVAKVDDSPKVIVAKPVEAVVVSPPPRPIVVARRAEPPMPRAPHVEVAERAPAPPPQPVRRASHRKDDIESANAADALAKAQLDAALSR